MKIGITCYPTYGGSGVVATELGKALAQRGHEIHFISYSLPFRLQHYHERIFFHEVEMVTYPLLEHPPYAITLAAKMSEVGAQVGLDLFHVHYAIPHAVSAFLARAILGQGRPRIITTLHGTDITLVGNDRSLFPMTRFALEQSDGVTCVSRYLQGKTREVFDTRLLPGRTAALQYRRRIEAPGMRVLLKRCGNCWGWQTATNCLLREARTGARRRWC